MEKLCDRIDWNNNTSPALNDTNLNLMSKAIDDIDDRVIAIARTVMETVPQIQEDLEEAQDLLEDAEAISTHPPIIGQNGNWWTWDTTIEDYADSGIDAGVSLTIGTTSTLTPGSDATVTNSGTDTDPILNFGIPQGVAGQDGQDGVSPEVTITTITGGHTVTITDADHPIGQSFNVMDGADGVGIPAGGTTSQVLKKVSGADYDTEWANESGGGSGGHTILDSSGTAMAQRANLQFEGATVTDDSANDKTIITTTPQSMIGDAWVSGHAYVVGDYAIDANALYKNGTAHTSTATNRPSVNQSGYWTLVNVASEITDVTNKFSSLSFQPLVPILTSNTSAVGITVSASSVYSSNYPAWKAFNDNFDEPSRWNNAQSESAVNSWLRVKFDNKKRVAVIRVRPFFYQNALLLKNFVIQGSNNGTSWDTLYTGSFDNEKIDTLFFLKTMDYYYYYQLKPTSQAYWPGLYESISIQRLQLYEI